MEDFEIKSKQLLSLIEAKYVEASKTRALIRKLEFINEKRVGNIARSESSSKKDLFTACESERDCSIEDEVSFYLEGYKALDGDFTLEDMIKVLPNRDSYSFITVILSLQVESLKMIKEIKDLIETEDLEQSDIDECKKFLNNEYRKLNMLYQIRNMGEDECELFEHKKNKVILVPNPSGNIRIIEDIEHISSEYYPQFLELFNSIIDGSFKGIKKFVNNSNIVGIFEVKDFKIRILFSKIAEDTYAVITAFVKKTDSNSIYIENVTNRAASFNDRKRQIISMLDDPDFLEENEKNIEELIRILSSKSDSKQLRMGCSND